MQWIKYYESTTFPNQHEYLGWWLSSAHNVGQATCYWVLKENGQVIARTTVHSLFEDEICSEIEKQKCDQFDQTVADFLGEYDSELILEVPNDEPAESGSQDTTIPPMKETEEDINNHVMGPDPIINAMIYLPKGDWAELGRVINRKWNANGLLIGRKHQNPMLD